VLTIEVGLVPFLLIRTSLSRFAFVDLSAGPFAWGPAVGGDGVRSELSLPNVAKTVGSVAGHFFPNYFCAYYVSFLSVSILQSLDAYACLKYAWCLIFSKVISH
jgi:hypothetical protein